MGTAKKKVIVGLSGGVDSSVAAALLLREGHEVVGAFMKNWSEGDGAECGESCGWQKERQDALRVAGVLGIPFLTFDFEKEYRERVVGYMVAEYAAGRTPNPDVLCNREVKFDLFLKAALAEGADAIATGHYARAEHGQASRLLTGLDANKDQSYFLHQLTQEQLSRTLFPVGHLPKAEVRRLAREFGLPTADKKDSQGICFVGKVDLADFLRGRIPQRPGPIVTDGGREIGRHQGLAPYTIGQRHGLGIGGGVPYFVLRKDLAANALIVAPANRPELLLSPECQIGQMHWIAGEPPALPLPCEVRLRYRQASQPCEALPGLAAGKIRLRFRTPQRAVTPGQFAVLYRGEECLGGGPVDDAA